MADRKVIATSYMYRDKSEYTKVVIDRSVHCCDYKGRMPSIIK